MFFFYLICFKFLLCVVCAVFVCDLKSKMARVIGLIQRMHQTMITLIIVIFLSDGINDVLGSTASSQNQVIENLKLLSQMDDSSSLQPPSRLRALLVNDLRNILVKNVCMRFVFVCESGHMIYCVAFLFCIFFLSFVCFNFKHVVFFCISSNSSWSPFYYQTKSYTWSSFFFAWWSIPFQYEIIDAGERRLFGWSKS